MKKQPAIPFFEARDAYQDSLEEYTLAAGHLLNAVETVIRLVDAGADPKTAVSTLKEHSDRFAAIAYGRK